MSEIVVVITGATGPSGSGSSALNDLTDVTITAAASGDILRHNGTAWVDAVGTTHFEVAGAAAAAQAASQPLDSDLTAIAALTTTAYGRAFLTLANQAATMALLSAASDTASGIVELATNAETATGTDTTRAVTPANVASVLSSYLTTAAAVSGYQPLDSDLTAIAALTTTSYGRAFLSLSNLAALQAVLGTGTPSASTYLRGDGTWSTPSGGGAVATDTIFDAKGDLPVGTGADTAAKLTVGSNGTVPTADSAASMGISYKAPSFNIVTRGNTQWHTSPFLGTVSGTAWPIINRAHVTPFYFQDEVSITAAAINVTAAGTAANTVRVGLYSPSAINRPATILGQGTAAGDSTGVKTITFGAAVVVQGLVLAAAAPQGASSPGSTWLGPGISIGAFPQSETGASWSATIVGASQSWEMYWDTGGSAFANNPTVTIGANTRMPMIGLRIT